MKIYVDSSALLARYFKEENSDAVVRMLQETHSRIISVVTLVELAAVFRRALKGHKISAREHRTLTDGLRNDLKHFRIQTGGEELFRQAALVADMTGLRSLDSIHLASAKLAGADRVMTFDREMIAAAPLLGLQVWSRP